MHTHAPPRFPDLAAAIAVDGRPKYQIAAAAGYPPNMVGGILSGRLDPTPEIRRRFADALGRPVDELFGGQS